MGFLKTMKNNHFNLINNDGDVLTIFHLEIAKLPRGKRPGVLHYCDNETGSKDQILFRISTDKTKLLAWSAAAAPTRDQIFPIMPLQNDNGEINGMEIQFDANNTAMFVIPEPEPTYWPSEEVFELEIRTAIF